MMDDTYEEDLADFRQNDLDSGVPRPLVQLSCGMHYSSLETREFYVHMISYSTYHSTQLNGYLQRCTLQARESHGFY
jgi:hypothetical protein